MNLHWIDWSIVVALIVFVTYAAIATQKYTQGVSDFLVASRCAGRYLICVAQGITGVGAIGFLAQFEVFYSAGFTPAWWALMLAPLTVLMASTGWVVYRYRETRSMTLAQFFEMRYSKRFRVFAGMICWLSGVINFGIFPSVGAKFFIYFCGIPELRVLQVPGIGDVSSTFILTMLCLIGISLLYVFLGGQITIMITDFIQGSFTNVACLIILIVFFFLFDWSLIIETLKAAPEPDSRSLLDPLKTSRLGSFNYWYYILSGLLIFYTCMTYQGSQGYWCSAKSAHEAKMASILGEWRFIVMVLIMMLLPIGAYVIMHHPRHADIATKVDDEIATIENRQVATQMLVPLVLVHTLPLGVKGLLAAAMLAGFISTHATLLHSWGSIFVQDVLLPLRKAPISTQHQLLLLRASILFVAVFVLMFSLLFTQTEYILLFMSGTGAIFMGGAGIVIIGGLYWKHGNTAGAWLALGGGTVFSTSILIVRQYWSEVYTWLELHAPQILENLRFLLEGISNRVGGIDWTVGPEAFPFDGIWTLAFTAVFAVTSYVAASLIGWLFFQQKPIDLDKLLHRGKWSLEGEHQMGVRNPVSGWLALLPTSEFTIGDKFIYFGQLSWTFLGFAIFVTGTVFALVYDVSVDTWATFWGWQVCVTFVLGSITTLWFFLGGLRDISTMFKTLNTLKRDHADTGEVIRHPSVLRAGDEKGSVA
jgi:SSS family solute:Na+ symporter